MRSRSPSPYPPAAIATGGLKLCAGVLAACLGLLGSAAEATAQAQPNRDTARSTVPRAALQPARPLPPGQAPPMMLAQATATTRDALPLPVTRYWVSEKYDGVRAWWDGHTLRTRQGHRIAAPDWFTAGWPRVAMDGELWAGRGRFEVSSATVQSLQPGDDAWRGLRFMVFDLPEQAGPFQARLAQLQALAGRPAAAGPTTPTWAPVPQWREASFTSLQAKLRQVHDHGAEGLMLHDDQALHVVGRSPALIKFKPLDDAEAVVIGHVPGQVLQQRHALAGDDIGDEVHDLGIVDRVFHAVGEGRLALLDGEAHVEVQALPQHLLLGSHAVMPVHLQALDEDVHVGALRHV